MLNCFTTENQNAVRISLVTPDTFSSWLSDQSDIKKNWLNATQFRPDAGQFQLLPDEKGALSQVVCCIANEKNPWHMGHLPFALPQGNYQLEMDDTDLSAFAIVWGLGAYQFARYKKPLRSPARLYLKSMSHHVNNIVESIYNVRDWINIPTENMGPSEFAKEAERIAKENHAEFLEIIGDDLLKQNYPAIHAVGRASDDEPRLLDLRWGDKAHPKVTLVGKGVCFDTGGLDIKPSQAMLLMKKDMAGGAHVLGLARMIMQAKLPICLRVLIPVVEMSSQEMPIVQVM
jgi:leucyl aminopeptidase